MAKKKKYKSKQENKKIINLLFLNLFLFSSGVLWLDYLGIINIKENIYPNLAKIPGISYFVPKRKADRFLLENIENEKRKMLKDIEWKKLKDFEKKLKEKELEIDKKNTQLENKEKELIAREKYLKEKYAEKDTYKDKIARQAKYFVSMRPEDAVKRLDELDDLTVIDILKEIEREAHTQGKQSIVPYFLSLMDPKRAAVIQRKMLIVEEDNSSVFSTNE